jgi:kojibiose phosphorylase
MSVVRRQQEEPEPHISRLGEYSSTSSDRPSRRTYANALPVAYDGSEQFSIVSPLHMAALQQFQLARTGQVQSKEAASEQSLWEISTDGYCKEAQAVEEVVYTMTNGILAINGCEEGNDPSIHTRITFLKGNYEDGPSKGRIKREDGTFEPMPIPKLVNAPGWQINFHNGTEWFDIDTAKINFYRKKLDMQDGTVIREIEWEDSTGKITFITTKQFVNRSHLHAAGTEYAITPLNYSAQVRFKNSITRQQNQGPEHTMVDLLEETDKGSLGNTGVYYTAKAPLSDNLFAIASDIDVSSSTNAISPENREFDDTQRDTVAEIITFNVQSGATYTLHNKVALYSTYDLVGGDPKGKTIAEIRQLPSNEITLKTNREILDERWKIADFQIVGDDEAQLAVRFNNFSLLQLAQTENPCVAVPVKGLSSEFYDGHIFWEEDAEVIPVFTYWFPEVARNLLFYRLKNGQAASEKAREHGYDGWWFQWQSTIPGRKEATPPWYENPDGTIGKVYTGEHAFHHNATIARAAYNYLLFTGDAHFFTQEGGGGADLIMQTARFWVSKATKDRNGKKKRYELHGVIGPDEYHETSKNGKEEGVNNNAFTNEMARENIQIALDLAEQFKDDPQLHAAFRLTEQEKAKWQEVVDKMYSPYDPKSRIYYQFDGFKSLRPLDFRRWYPPQEGAAIYEVNLQMKQDKKKRRDPNKYLVIKQADSLLLLDYLDILDLQVARANYLYYDPITAHGSTFSKVKHIIAALRAGFPVDAFEYLQDSLEIPLKKSDRGTPVVVLAGVVQAIIKGYVGLINHKDGLKLEYPQLPPNWKKLTFSIVYQSQHLQFHITENNVDVFNVTRQEPFSIKQKGQVEPH